MAKGFMSHFNSTYHDSCQGQHRIGSIMEMARPWQPISSPGVETVARVTAFWQIMDNLVRGFC